MKKVSLLIVLIGSIFLTTTGQNVGIGITSPLTKLHISSTDSALLLLENTQVLNTGVSTALYYKIGNVFTGAIKTIAQSSLDARIGFFTYSTNYSNLLLERMSILDNGNVGIGTSSPLASLHVIDNSVLFSASGNIPGSAGNTPISGAGRRMMWYPDKAAFRVGYVFSTEWDKNFIGNYSFASGYGTRASGDYSTAMGFQTNANGIYSTAMGYNSIANVASTAIGYIAKATGNQSTALGYLTTASGDYSTAMGFQASTNGMSNSFAICASGLGGYPSITNENNNEFMVYAEHYKFWTSTTGQFVNLVPGANSWTGMCDKNRKENFEPLNGEDVLKKISKISFTSWNYKNQDPKIFRHYGIMAQDFYAAFGKDKYGTIGCDTLVNPIDMIGIDMAAIQALEKRTEKIEEQQQEIEELKKQNQTVNKNNSSLQSRLNDVIARLETLQKKFETFTASQKQNNSSLVMTK